MRITERLARTHALQRWVFDRFVPPRDFPTYDQWRTATQDYQATLLRHHIETLKNVSATTSASAHTSCI